MQYVLGGQVMVFLNSSEDMKWLRDVHIPGLPPEYEAAVVHGNEDSPSKIEVYQNANPTIREKPMVFVADLDGVLKLQT